MVSGLLARNTVPSLSGRLQRELYATGQDPRNLPPPYKSLFGFSHNPHVPDSIPVTWTVREERAPFWVPDSDWITDPNTGALLRRIDEPEAAPKPIEKQQTSEPLYRRFLHGVKETAASPFSYIKEHSWSTVPDAVVAAGKAIGHGTANAFAYTKEHPWQVAGAVTLPLLLVPTLAACSSPDPTSDVQATMTAQTEKAIANLGGAPISEQPKQAFSPTSKPSSEMFLPRYPSVEIISLEVKSVDDVRSEFRRAGNIEGSRVLAKYPPTTQAVSFDFIGKDDLNDAIIISLLTGEKSAGFKPVVYENNGISLIRKDPSNVDWTNVSPVYSFRKQLTGANIYKSNKVNLITFQVEPSVKGYPSTVILDPSSNYWLTVPSTFFVGNFDEDPHTELAYIDFSTPVRVYELDGKFTENKLASNEIALAVKDFARASLKGNNEDIPLLWQEHGHGASLTALALLEGSDPGTYQGALEERLKEGAKLQQVIWDRQQLSRAERALLVSMQSGSKDELRSAVEGMRANDPAPALAAMFRIYGDDFQRYVSERVAGLDVALLAGEMVRGRFDSAFANATIGNYGGALFDLAIAYGIERGAAASVRYISDHQNLSPLRERNVDTTYALSGLQIDRDLLTADEQNALTSGGAVNNVISVKRMDEIKAAQEARNKQESLWSSLFGN